MRSLHHILLLLTASVWSTPLSAQRVVRSTPFAEISVRAFHAEGVGWDPRTHSLYVGSVRDGVVARVSMDKTTSTIVPAHTADLRAVFGVTVDTLRDLLWVSSADVPERDGGVATPRVTSAIHAFGLATGAPAGRWELPRDGRDHVLGDVVLAPDGRVWTTDSYGAGVYRVPADLRDGPLEPVAFSHPDWVSLQGITFSADNQTAWLADWSRGLFQVDLRTARVSPVTDTAGETLRGIDGLYWTPRGIVAIQNGAIPPRVIRVTLDSSGTRFPGVEVLDHPPGPGEPTLGVLTPEGFLFVATSLWPFYGPGGRLDPDQPLPTAQIRRLALP